MTEQIKQVTDLPADRLRSLISRVKEKGGSGGSSLRPRRDPGGPQPLSFAQERLWFLDRLGAGGAAYAIPSHVRLSGPLDAEALARTFAELVRRHESLRTTFGERRGVPFQEIAPAGHPAGHAIGEETPMPRVDLSGLPGPVREGEMLRLAGEEARRPFDLARGPLLRNLLVRLGPEDHLLATTMHHIVSDGWSMTVLVREMAAVYEAFSAGLPSPLPEPALQYADFAVWQREHLAGERLASELAWWSGRLAGVEPLELPTDRPRPAVQSHRGARRRLALSAATAAGLRELGQREGASLFMVLLALWDVLLGRYSGRTDLAVGTPVANRNRGEVQGLIGFFVNTLVLRTGLAGRLGFRELLGRVRETALEAFSHDELPFEKLVERLQPERLRDRNPLFQVMCTLQNQPWPEMRIGEVRLAPLDLETGLAKLDLSLTWSEGERGLEATLEHSTDLFDGATAQRLLRHWLALVRAVLDDPERAIDELPLLSAAERAEALAAGTGAHQGSFPEGTIHALLEEQAALRPDAVAVEFEDASLSFAALEARANQIARALRRLGAGPGAVVGFHVPRSLEMIAGLFGVLESGAAYLPLDFSHPRERLAAMIEDCRPVALLTLDAVRGELPDCPIPVLRLDADREAVDRESPAAFSGGATAGDLVFVMYTSGSTGRPKGVLVTHRGLLNRFLRTREFIGLGPRDVVLHKSPLAFDFSIWEALGAITAGGRSVVARPDGHVDFPYLARLLDERGTTIFHFVPTLLEAFLSQEGLAGCGASVRQVLTGGEALTPALRDRFFARFRVPLDNQYGPTEGSIDVTWERMLPEGPRPPVTPIGRPHAWCAAHVLAPSLEPLPPGAPGELFLGGVCLARGYLDRPDLTAERFIPDPFGDGHRLYRTGDLARRLPGGEIEYLGRIDHQIKIRGVRIEPGEIEAALLRHPRLREAAVVVHQGSAEKPGKRLVAWLSAEEPAPDARELRALLARTLPETMIPSAFVRLPALPRLASAKIDRGALARREPEEGFDSVRSVGSDGSVGSPVEELIAGIWGELLGVEAIGAGDDFFALGGHSLLAVQVVSRLRERLGVEISVRALFDEPALAGFARRVELGLRRERGEPAAAPPLSRIPRDGRLPLSFAQQRLWFLDQLDPGSAAYNVPAAVELAGRLDVPALAAAFGEVVRRHEALRTTFRATADGPAAGPVQVVAEPAGFALPLVDLQGLPGPRSAAEERLLAIAEARRPFDLNDPEGGPLLRAALLRIGAERHVLLLAMHHIASDGWSVGVLVREIGALYAAFAEGRPSPLPELAVQYADFAAWQRRHLSGEVLEAELAWWRRELAGMPRALDLPTDHPRPAAPSGRGAVHAFAIEPEDLAGLTALSRRHGATLFMTLLAGFAGLLGRITGQDDLAVGTPVAGRTRVETEPLIGFFVNTLVLRAGLAGDPDLEELLGRVRTALLAAWVHQEVPFERLVEELAPERDASRPPLVQTLLVLQNTPSSALQLPGLALDASRIDTGTAKFELTCTFAETESGLQGTLEYSRDLWERPFVERLAGHFTRLLAGAVADPRRRLSELPLLSAQERAQVLVEWSGETTAYPREAAIHALFDGQAALRPDTVAVVGAGGAGESLTYGELRRRAGLLARRLRTLGVGLEVRVGVCLDRSPSRVLATLAVLEAGGAYVPLDPFHPPERLAAAMCDSAAAVLVTEDRWLAALPRIDATVLCIDREETWEVPASVELPEVPASGLAYVMYTSGSTGEPKGVAVPHRAVVRLVRETGYARFGADEVFLQLAPYAFDAATLELWGALLNGGRLVVPPPGVLSPAELGELLADHGVTTLWLTAGLFHQMVEDNLPGLAGVRQLLAGGDVLSPQHVRRVVEELPGTRLINGYGPTENTTFTCCHPAAAEDLESPVPLGRPIANTRVYVLDSNLAPVPAGVAGELCAAGDGLARGYLDRPEWTAERFVPNPFGDRSDRLYRTGDLARYRPDGRIEFLGRIDAQVKIRGFRIEPGEIEAALLAHGGVRDAVVAARPGPDGQRRLVAWVVPVSGGPAGGEEARPLGDELRLHLRQRLPEPMIPSAFVEIPELPLNANGKLDRAALPEPEPASAREEYVAPRTPVEELIAGIWAEVLGLEGVGVCSDFFALGGHSLLATRVVTRVRQAMGVDLAVRALFDARTVAGLALTVTGESLTRTATRAPAIPPRPPGLERLPLSFSQERLWFLDRLDPGSPVYNLPAAVELRGELRPAALAATLSAVVRRHESLRTTFDEVGGVPVQRIAPPAETPLPRIDLAALPDEARGSEAARLAAEHAARRFDLARGPLLAAALLRLETDCHRLLLAMHHIVSDGWSMGILIREVAALYGAFVEGRPSALPELPVQYADFALWQRETAAGHGREQDLAWWSERLAGPPAPLDLPMDRPRPAVRTWRGGGVARTLPADLSRRLRSFSQAEGASLFMTLLAGAQSLFHRLAGQDDVVVGSPIAGRRQTETEPLIGLFLNLLALRTDLAGDPGFREVVARVRDVTLGAYAHQDLPFEALLAHLQPERDLARTPLFQVLFNMLNLPEGDLRLPGLEVAALALPDLASKFDLTFYVHDDPAGIAIRLVYNADLFDAGRVEELLDQLQLLLEAGVEDPQRGVDGISLAATPRARSVLPDPAAELSAAWEGAVHEVFARHARWAPQALAVADPAESWTYGELDERADRLAAFLSAAGVGPGGVVAFWAHRSAPLVWGVLGALKAGAAFLMLDPRHPAPRQAQMLAMARPAAWLRVAAAGPVPAEIERALDAAGCTCRLTLPARADDPGFLAGVPAVPPAAAVGPDDVAYVAFTSGSTGVPKGVLGRHGSLSHFIPWLCRRFGLSAADRFSLLSGLAHDPLHRDLFTPLQSGAAVVIPDPETMDEPGRLAAWMRREGVTVAHLTPALGQLLTTEAPNRPRIEVPSLRWVFLVGDVLTRRDVARLRRLAPEVTCVNYYGSTETQRAVGYHVAQADGPKEILPLGRGIPGVQILVLNPAGALAGIGELGEISMRSPHLALGYLGDPRLTAERFAADRYRTGDLGRYLPNGEAVFAGRADTQVKIRGFRIELGEIESVLGGFPGVREAVVVARQDRGAERYLAAYFVPVPGAAPTARELRELLRERLPDAMVPATFTLLGELPLTPNRKVDRKALPAPDRGAEAAFVAPESDLEREVAAVWREVLGVGRVGVQDNFFELGGHSLLLVRLHARLQEALKMDLSLIDLFSHPNVQAQAEYLRRRRAGARRDPLPARRSPAPAGGRIAIVGMAGRFPGARDLEAFWRNLREGVESVSFFSEEELLASGVPLEVLRHPSYVPARAVVEGDDLFDAAFFDVPPRQAELMDPQLRFFLETAWHALESAGIDPERHPGAIGLYGGVAASTYLLGNLLSHPGLLREIGPGALLFGTDRDYLTTQVSYKLGLGGPSIDVQTACSTSLVATHLACQALLAGDCDVALAGGVSIKVPQRSGYVYQESGPDSSDGHCRAFDARADGAVYGSGVGLVVLKRMEDAIEAGDPIRAVILGSALNNDGSRRVGFTAPSIEGQAAVVTAALDRAGVEPATISYVECHGSGTVLGDPIEVAALSRAFGGTGTPGSCAIGSVKPSIGHLAAAGGVAALIKAVLALEHREIPPSLNFETPNPKIDFAASPFRVNSRLSPWPGSEPRRAGVTSLGQGGTNAHAVLEEAPGRGPSGPSRPWQLLVLSARTETALETATDNLAGWLERQPAARLADAAFTLQVGRRAFAHRRALVCRDADEARRILAERDPRRLLTGVQDGGRRPVAFLLSGVGDHHPGMARGLYETEPVFRAALDRCCEILADGPWRDLREVVFGGGERAAAGGLDLRRMFGRGNGDGEDQAARRLHRTLYAQPAVFAVDYALARLWISWGVEPEALLGYSLGEYVAACLAGVFALEDALPLVAERARWIEELPAGAMLAVPLPEEEARGRLSPGLDLAAVNGPQLSVVSGPPEEVAALARRLAEEEIPTRQLPTTHAFHSRAMEPLAERLTERVRRLRPAAPRIPLLSNVTGTWLSAEEAADPAWWARHLCGPVRFADGLAELWKNPARVLLEVGPGQGLSALALQHPAASGGRIALPSLPHAHERQDDTAFLLGTLGRLWLAGVAIDPAGFWGEERRHRLELPLYPFERRRFWVEPARPFSLREEVQAPEAPALQALTIHQRPRLPHPHVAPRNETEAWIADQIERLLGIADVGVHDSFFALGGHSLLGTRLLSRLRDELGPELPLATLFASPTPAELAVRIEEARAAAPEAAPSIERLPRTGLPIDLPLSFAQERLWFLDQLEPGGAAYNIPSALRLEGPLDVAALAGALTEVARRHETLRTTFPAVDGAPVQRISPPASFPLAMVDLAGLPEAPREAEGARLAVEELRAPFDLARGPLVRASLVRLGEHGHLLLATQHHIVSDGWSLGLFVRETAALYRALADGRIPALPALPVQYADFASWQRRRLSGPGLAGQVAWWRERLTPPPPVLELPADRPRPAVETFRGGRHPFTLPVELMASLANLGREQGATLFMTLLAGFQALLGRLTDQEDLAVGTPIAGRTRGEVEHLIGLFINTLVLRADLSGDPTFSQVLARVRDAALGAFAHQDLPFERLVEELRPERNLGRSPLFQVLFILQNLPTEDAVATGLTLRPLDVYHGVSRFDLTFLATEIAGELRGYLEYKTDLLEAATAARWLGHLGTLLTAAAAEPARRLSELPVLSAAERRQILEGWNDTAAEVPAACVHHLIAGSAARSPADVAVVFEGERLTRGELEERAARLAGRLRALGAGPESLVGIYLERSLDLLVATLGVWKAGAAYLPLDPAYPAERIGFMLADSGVRVVLTHERLAAALPEHGARLVCLDREPRIAAEPVDDGGAGPEHLAYVLYTSGSTGRPKGVQVTHGALANFLASMLCEPGLADGDVLLAVTSLSFDIAGLELYLPLLAGARLEIASSELAADGARLAARMRESGVTAMQATPATWRLLLGAGWDEPGGPGGLRLALCGGETLPGDLAASLRRRAGAVWNLYGPTETTIWSAAFRVEGGTAGSAIVPIGRPIANTRIYVLDRRMAPVPAGVPGEVWIGGAGVARGYLGRPDLTAERYLPDPWSRSPGARLYRTGDLARYRPDGRLEHLGRIDLQVKIRGFRIEPGEIEAALGAQPGMRQAVVLAREDRGEKRLVAYLVPEREGAVAVPALRQALRGRLPAHMVPADFVLLERLPLTPNGKVDRRALPAPAPESGPDARTAAPANDLEEWIAAVWREVLRVERIGALDNFFDLGGHSLLATRIASRLGRALGVAPPVRWIFEQPTVRGLAARIAAAGRMATGEEDGLPILRSPRGAGSELPLSFAQQRLWVLDKLEPGSNWYNVAAALRLEGELDLSALAAALTAIVRRHEPLRTTFPTAAGRPRQEIAAELPDGWLRTVDLTALPHGVREAAAGARAAEEVRQPFDLAAGPLLRCLLLRLDEREHLLALTAHHIVCDAWSIGLFVRELTVLYHAAVRGERPALPELPVQYADFAAWQRRRLTGERVDRLVAEWRDRLAGAPAAIELPADRPHPPLQTFRGGTVPFRLGAPATAGLYALARAEGASLFMALLAGFQALLHRYSGQDDVVVGTPVAGRVRPEVENLIGVFINTLALRGDLGGAPTFRVLLGRARDAALTAYALQDLPFERLVEELQPVRDLARSPLFQVMLILQNAPFEPLALEGVTWTPLPVDSGTAKMELLLSAVESRGELAGQLEHNAGLFDRATARRLAGHLEALLAGAAADPDVRLADLPLLPPAEREQILREWNDTAAEIPAGCLHELVAAQAARTPDATAVSCGASGESLSYAGLLARADRLARELSRLGIGPETLVGLAVGRSPDLVVALLGILAAGGAYLPLDPSYPAERLSMVLEDARPRVLMTEQALARGRFADLPGRPEHILLLDAPRAASRGEGLCAACPVIRTLPDDLAYVLFTSGSTGRPKGVAVTHRALLNFLAAMGRAPGLAAGGPLLAVTSLSFDIAGLEIWLPLLCGGCVEIATQEEAADGRLLAARLAAGGARTMQATPSTWRMLLDTGWAGDPGLAALCGGEALPRDLAARLAGKTGALWNLYGPTETTIWSSLLRVGAEEAWRGAGAVSIGRPIDNTALHVLDRGGFPVPVGVPGELQIGGVGLARGYFGRPNLTAERFVPDPFSAAAGDRLYRTGDLARRRPDGALEFLGRLDHQVKVRGFRIELGEIEAALARHPAVAQAVILAAERGAETLLVGHVVPRQPVAAAELRSFLAGFLPAYMVPSVFHQHAALPLTPNGKIDRKALSRQEARSPAETAPEAPASPLEEALARIWAEVLGVQVGRHDDFFALGGHSILATVLMHRVRDNFGVDLPLRALFAAPTVAGLSAAVAARRTERGEDGVLSADLPRIAPDPVGQHLPFPLTDVQEAYWIGRSAGMELGSVATHIYFEVDTTGLDLDRFERALRRLIDRHGMLRAIVQPDGRQRILAEVPPYALGRHDLRAPASEDAGETLAAVRERMAHQVLPSDRWPLFEIAASLLPENPVGETRVRLHVSLDLLIGDAWSLRLLVRDLGLLYERPEAPLPKLEISFRDYVLAEAALCETAAWRQALEYWRGRLADFPPPPALPLAGRPAAVTAPRFVRRQGELAPEAWARLKQRAAGAGLTPSGALLAAWSEVLAAWSGSSRFTLNLTLFNRLPLHPQVDQLVGDFTSLTLLAVERLPGEPFVEGAHRLQRRLWDDLDHRLVSGVQVLRELSRLRGEPRTIMPVVFTSTLNQASPEPAAAAGSSVRTEGGWGISQTPQVWLDHQVTETGGTLAWKWDAVEELFPAGLLDDMLGAYGRLLERLAGQPGDDQAAWREPVRGLLPAEQLDLIAEANATAAPAPAGLLHEPFLEQARRAPGAPAVITSSWTVTYGELDRLSLALARRLRQLGAGPNRLVAVVMHKGWEQVAAVLAVLRAGAAYLPVDARLPAERIRHLIVRGEVAVALTQPGASLPLPEGIERVVVEAQDGKDSKDGKDEDLENPAAAGDLAYVIFTSGSTGEPKGVMIDHRGALNTVIDVNRRFGVGPGDRVLALSSLSFDLSVWDVFGVLAAGGAVVVPDAGSERDPEHWAVLAARERVTVWNTVPALLEMLVEHGAGRPGALAAPLRLVLLSGDWIPPRLPDRIRAAFPGARVISLGGATEASIWSILFPIGEVGAEWTSIPYGRAMANQSFHVLDEDLEPCPVWVPGHLWIGGIGLALGYWRDEEKTRASFQVHPRSGERLYRTGDLGRLLPGGDVELLGRDDTQVKVQGHRIELGEIEAALAGHPAVAAAVVAAVGERNGPKQLVAYVVPQPAAAGAPERPAVMTDPMERLRFKLAHHGLRRDEERTAFELERPELSPERIEALYLRRRSFRSFLREPVPLSDLAGLLSCLLPVDIAGSPFPKHRYGSAGNLYPVQTWLYVKAGRVDGLPGGVYYHDPRRHRLALVSSENHLDASLWGPTNRAVFEEAAFAVLLIARLAAIAPLYGERARHLAALEAGLMTQLLETAAPDHRIGLAQMGGFRFEAVRQRFALDESCELVHTLLGGRIDAAQTGLAAFLAEMAEQQALVRLVEEHPEEIAAAAAPPPPQTPRSDADLFAALREHLRSRLPEPLVPALWVRLDALPLSANGKVDRKALPPPEAAPAEARPAAVYAAPETEIEQALAGIVAEVLGVPRVGLHDNFFDLGASSVHIVRVHNALRERLGTEIPIVEMFNHPSVSHLACRLAPEATASDPGADRGDRLREGKDWRRQRLEKLRAMEGL